MRTARHMSTQEKSSATCHDDTTMVYSFYLCIPMVSCWPPFYFRQGRRRARELQGAPRSGRAPGLAVASVSLSERLALKTSVQILYDKQPSLLPVPFFDAGGTQTGQVLTPGDT